jgi:hypothetical protein
VNKEVRAKAKLEKSITINAPVEKVCDYVSKTQGGIESTISGDAPGQPENQDGSLKSCRGEATSRLYSYYRVVETNAPAASKEVAGAYLC